MSENTSLEETRTSSQFAMTKASTIPMTPVVSVLLSVYNGRPYLRESVDSILQQTLQELELIVIDDGSTDGSLDVLKDLEDPRLRVFRQENTGKAIAINRAREKARGEFFAIQDADDWSHPQRLEKQVAALRDEPDLAGVYCSHELILEGRRCAPRARALSREECRSATERMTLPAHDPTGTYRAAKVEHIQFEKDSGVADGLEFILKVSEEHPLKSLGQCLYAYRIHFNSITRDNVDRRLESVRGVIERACERRGLGREAASRFIPPPSSLGERRLRDNNLPAHFMESVIDLRQQGRWLSAIGTGWRCARLHPFDFHYLKALIYSLVPKSWIQKMRKRLKESQRLAQET